MKNEQYSLNDRKRLMTKLMEHRQQDVATFAERVDAMFEGDGLENEDLVNNIRLRIQALRDDLDDIDHALVDVVLATDLLDARSIVSGFRTER